MLRDNKGAALRKTGNSFLGLEEQSIVDQHEEQSTAMGSQRPGGNSPAQRKAATSRHFTNVRKSYGIHCIP